MNNKNNPLTKKSGLLSSGKQNFVIILAAVVLFVVFYLINPGFASKGNLLTMTKALVPYAILSLGVTFVIATGGTYFPHPALEKLFSNFRFSLSLPFRYASA